MAMGVSLNRDVIYDGKARFIPFENRYMIEYIGMNGRDLKYKKISFRECKKLEESYGPKWTELDWNIKVFGDRLNGKEYTKKRKREIKEYPTSKYFIYLNETKGYACKYKAMISKISSNYYYIKAIIPHVGETSEFPIRIDEFNDELKFARTVTLGRSTDDFIILGWVSINNMSIVHYEIKADE